MQRNESYFHEQWPPLVWAYQVFFQMINRYSRESERKQKRMQKRREYDPNNLAKTEKNMRKRGPSKWISRSRQERLQEATERAGNVRIWRAAWSKHSCEKNIHTGMERSCLIERVWYAAEDSKKLFAIVSGHFFRFFTATVKLGNNWVCILSNKTKRNRGSCCFDYNLWLHKQDHPPYDIHHLFKGNI